MINPEDLIRLANKGDKAAYCELLEWLANHARYQIKINLRNYYQFPEQSLDDIIQDVLITFHQTHQSFDTLRPLLPWINTIIKHKTIDFMRKKDFKIVMTSLDISSIEELWAIEESEHPESEIFLEILESLPADQCNLLKMAKLEGLTGKEISQKLNISESNVKVMVHRAVKELKRLASSSKYKKQ